MIIELLYTSKAKKDISPAEISSIIAASHKFNTENDITGCLLYHKGEFIHLLEGEQKKVHELYSKIMFDKRNTDVSMLIQNPIEKRYFSSWTMTFDEIAEINTGELKGYISINDFHNLTYSMNRSSNARTMFMYLTQTIIEGKSKDI